MIKLIEDKICVNVYENGASVLVTSSEGDIVDLTREQACRMAIAILDFYGSDEE